jgi:hypothetical protein
MTPKPDPIIEPEIDPRVDVDEPVDPEEPARYDGGEEEHAINPDDGATSELAGGSDELDRVVGDGDADEGMAISAQELAGNRDVSPDSIRELPQDGSN